MIEELNQAIRELRDRINLRAFRKREGSRASQFAAVDKPALSPLPAERFDLSEWSRARVIDASGLVVAPGLIANRMLDEPPLIVKTQGRAA